MGSGNVIGPYAVIGGNTVIGDNNWFGASVIVGAPPEIRSFEHPEDWVSGSDPSSAGVLIGDNNRFREAVQIHSGWMKPTRVAHNAFLMNQVYLAHDCVLGDTVTIASSATLGGHVVVGDGATIGLGAAVHQRRVIGALAMVGMSSVITKDVPAFAMAFGNPCRVEGVNEVGMQRNGFDADEIAWARHWVAGAAGAAVTDRLAQIVEAYERSVAR